MNKRLAMLEKMCASDSAESFAWYGLAMEYRKEQRFADSLATFGKLRERDPDYLPMYLMAAQVLLDELDQEGEARPWLEQGIELAKRKGDSKALGELQDALAACD